MKTLVVLLSRSAVPGVCTIMDVNLQEANHQGSLNYLIPLK